MPALRGRLLRILVHLVIGDDHHDPDEDAERELLRFGGTASATASSGSISIISDLDQPEVEIGLAPSSVFSRRRRRRRPTRNSSGRVSSSSSSLPRCRKRIDSRAG